MIHLHARQALRIYVRRFKVTVEKTKRKNNFLILHFLSFCHSCHQQLFNWRDSFSKIQVINFWRLKWHSKPLVRSTCSPFINICTAFYRAHCFIDASALQVESWATCIIEAIRILCWILYEFLTMWNHFGKTCSFNYRSLCWGNLEGGRIIMLNVELDNRP